MRIVSSAVAVLILSGAAQAKPAASLTLDSVNAASFTPLPDPPAKAPAAEIIRAEVLLDRARFSPGAIDGIDGDNFRKALAAYQTAKGMPSTGKLDEATWGKLTGEDGAPVLADRPLTKADLKGPFAKHIPAGFEKQAGLKRLAYANVQEEIAEQVHASVSLLRLLNKGAAWKKPGGTLTVPQVVVDRGKTPLKVTRVTVDKPGHDLQAFGADGKLVAFYPASIGSDEKPAPTGQFVIRRVIHNPDYTYNPKYAFKGVKTTKPFTIAPGPNNPVGSVWMDLSYEGYGIHGTPQPDLVGKTQSHGCIRLTNWDAEDLASMVADGTAVLFQDAAAAAPPSATPAAPPSATPAAAPAPAVTPDPSAAPAGAPSVQPAGEPTPPAPTP